MMIPSSNKAVIDLSDLAEMRAMDVALLNSIIDQYLLDIPPHLAVLQKAVLQKELELIRQEAHFFRGSSANFRAAAFIDICAKIETQARAGHFEGLEFLMEQFMEALKKVQHALVAAKEPTA